MEQLSKSNEIVHQLYSQVYPMILNINFQNSLLKSDETSINSGRLQMRNFEISYDKSGFFEVEVSPKPFDDNRLRKIFTRQFTAKQVGSLFLGKQTIVDRCVQSTSVCQ